MFWFIRNRLPASYFFFDVDQPPVAGAVIVRYVLLVVSCHEV